MQTLHLAPSLSAAGSLRQAFREAGLEQEILALPDDLSCGPIRDLGAPARMRWWEQFYDEDILVPSQPISDFWTRLSASSERLVVWAGRRSALESAFLLAVAHRLGDRSFGIIDVTDVRHAPVQGLSEELRIPGAVAVLPPIVLRDLVGTERSVDPQEHAAMREHWRKLLVEDAHFRIATPAGLDSAADDYFDATLMAEARAEPRRATRVIGGAMTQERAHLQVGDMMLLARLVALVETGKLIADGDPWDMRACFVRLPG